LKVSIIVPNYNYGKYIVETLEGLLHQTRRPDSIVIIDDASTDDSVERVFDYLGVKKQKLTTLSVSREGGEEINVSVLKYGIFNILQKEKNHGPSLTRNLGIEYIRAETDVFGLCDSDDEYRPDKISASLEMIEKQGFGIVYSDYVIMDEHKETPTVKVEHKENFSRNRLLQECIVSNNSFIHKKVFDQIGLYDEEMRVAEDYDLWIRASNAGVPIGHIAKPLYTYRVTGLGASFSVYTCGLLS
jgi:glycosyltransferase involved in cell wall biosynthesis